MDTSITEGYVYRKPVNKKLVLLHFIVILIFFIHHMFVCLYGVVIIFENYNNEIDLLRQVAVYFFGYGTNWNFLFQTVFLSLSLIYDALEWFDKHETRLAVKLRYFRDVIFSAAVFPYTLFISSLFWTLFLVDRELVFPEVYDLVVPWWFNHCVHTNIMIVVILETLIQARRHPADLKVELIVNGIIGVAYAIVYYSIYFFANRWLYAVFGIMTWWQVCLFQIMIWGSCFIFYFIQFPINRLFHKEDEILSAPVPTSEDVKEDINSIPGLHTNGCQRNASKENGNQVSPFSTKSWSLKFRSIKNQFENSSL